MGLPFWAKAAVAASTNSKSSLVLLIRMDNNEVVKDVALGEPEIVLAGE
jgi:hypothetical protein